MSRYGQKRCGYCGHVGHNRRTCPNLSDEAKQARKETINYCKELYGRKRKKVRCSQCGETGHNRKTCPEYKELLTKCQRLNLRMAEALRKLMNKKGICRGAIILENKSRLIPQSGFCWTKERIPVSYVVTNVDFEQFSLSSGQYSFVEAARIGAGDVLTTNPNTEQPVTVKINKFKRFDVKPTILGAASVEELKEINDSNYARIPIGTDSLVIEEDIEKLKKSYTHCVLPEAVRSLTRNVVIMPGCEPTKEFDLETKKRLTSESKFSRLRIDGDEKQKLDRRRIEKVERIVQFLEGEL